MYVRVTRAGTRRTPREYIQIVESYRSEDGKVKQRVLFTIGRKDKLFESGQYERLLKSMLKIAEDKFMIDGSSEECIKSLRLLGGVLAAEKGFKELGLDKKLKEIASRRKIQFDLVKAVKLMLINRLLEPKSKLSIERWKERLYNAEEYEEVKVQHIGVKIPPSIEENSLS